MKIEFMYYFFMGKVCYLGHQMLESNFYWNDVLLNSYCIQGSLTLS